jgi:hypothetical protein
VALIKCAECGTEVSTKAEHCPKCGAPRAHSAPVKPKSYTGRAVLITAGVVLLFVGFHLSSYFRSTRPPEVPLNARVVAMPGYFEVTNNDTYGWDNCDFDLNSDYAVKGMNVAPGATVRVALREFVKSDGTRFNFETTKPTNLYIFCRNTPGGTRSTLVGWK